LRKDAILSNNFHYFKLERCPEEIALFRHQKVYRKIPPIRLPPKFRHYLGIFMEEKSKYDYSLSLNA
jgi:hypothetical protein